MEDWIQSKQHLDLLKHLGFIYLLPILYQKLLFNIILYSSNTQSMYLEVDPYLANQSHQKNTAPTAVSPPRTHFDALTTSSLMDSSFECNLGYGHASVIWKASLDFLNNVLKCDFNKSKGLNDQNLFETELQQQMRECHIIDVIECNTLFTSLQRESFKNSIEANSQIKKLLSSLLQFFCQSILDQLTYVIYQIWQKYVEIKNENMLNEEMRKLVPPRIINFSTDAQLLDVCWPAYFNKIEVQEIISLSLQGANKQFFQEMFLNTKLCYINLKRLKRDVQIEGNRMLDSFVAFMGTIYKAVFLCCEGYFEQNESNGLNYQNQSIFCDQMDYLQESKPDKKIKSGHQ